MILSKPSESVIMFLESLWVYNSFLLHDCLMYTDTISK